MKNSALGFVLVAAIAAAAVAVPVTLHHRDQAKYLDHDAALQAQVARLAELSAESQQLSNAVARLERTALTREQHGELLRLRGQIGPLRRAARELEQLK